MWHDGPIVASREGRAMSRKPSRRDFVRTAAAATALGGARPVAAAAPAAAGGAAPAVRAKGAVAPLVIASANGNRVKNGGPRTCVAEAFERMTKGADVLDALIAGVNILELDPAEDSVGYGGLP